MTCMLQEYSNFLPSALLFLSPSILFYALSSTCPPPMIHLVLIHPGFSLNHCNVPRKQHYGSLQAALLQLPQTSSEIHVQQESYCIHYQNQVLYSSYTKSQTFKTSQLIGLRIFSVKHFEFQSQINIPCVLADHIKCTLFHKKESKYKISVTSRKWFALVLTFFLSKKFKFSRRVWYICTNTCKSQHMIEDVEFDYVTTYLCSAPRKWKKGSKQL